MKSSCILIQVYIILDLALTASMLLKALSNKAGEKDMLDLQKDLDAESK